MATTESAHLRALRPLLFALGLVICPGGGALAANIAYLFSGTIEGSLGGQPFIAPVIIGTMGNPATVVNGAVRCNNLAVVSLIWGSSGQTQILSPLSILVSNGGSYAGLRTGTCASGGSDWFHVSAPQFATYNLASSMGSIGTTGSYVNGGISLSTTDGTLVLTGQSLTGFEADLNQGPNGGAPVPLLSEWGLIALAWALAALGAARGSHRWI